MVVRVPTATPAPGRRRLIIIVVAVVAAFLVLFTALSGFFVDVLWFREVRLSDVFWTVLRTKVLLGLAFGLTFFVLLYSNLWIVRRITPRFHAVTPEQEIIERYRMQFEPYIRWLLPLFALVIAFFVALGVTSQWQTYLLWRNGSGLSFGDPEPLFHRDPAFYVFSLPWLKFMQGWLFSALVGVTFLTALAHYLWGGIRPQAPGFVDKVTPQVKAHMSVLLGLIMLTKAWGYYLGQFDLLTSTRGVVVGASYTDVNAQLPALRILVVIAIACAILFLVNIRLRGWALPVIAVGLLALVSIIAGAAYPAFVQRFRVAPQEFQREQPFIVDNIEATRRAFSLDGIQSSSRPIGESVTSEEVRENDATISNIRLWRPDVLRDNYISLQRFRSYYEFNDVDVDRYIIDGRAPRPDDLDAGGEPGRDPGGRQDLAERPPPVHARVRGGGLAGEHGDDRGPTRLHAPATSRRWAIRRSRVTVSASITGRARLATPPSSSSTPEPRSSTSRARRRTIRRRRRSRTTATAASRSAACSSARCSHGASATSTC